MGAPSPARFLSFGVFQLDLRARELRRNGVKVRVPYQSIQVLAMLLEHPGEVVTREEVHQRLWPHGTIVEFDHSINAAIKRLRQALEDSAEAPRYVETLPRLGYRFVGAVEQPAVAEEAAAPPLELEASPNEREGEIVSHYRILSKLGSGGMGVVYKAEDTRLGRAVALKFLPDEFCDDKASLERFQREAQAASALNHPNIITIHDIDRADGVHFISMEFVAGKTLNALIPRHGMRLGEVLKYAIQIADALAKAHAAGIIHRDLKPGNIMVTDQGLVKVLDFGLAKLTETGLTSEHDATRTLKAATEEGKIVGTVAYMSPEQAEGKPVDARTDIFSFGSVLYEALTGRQAFQGDTKASTIAAILREEPKPVSQVVEGLPREVERIVRRALRKDADHRFQTMGDLRVALEEVQEESDSGRQGAVSAVSASGGRRSWLRWALAGTAILLLAGGVMVYLRPAPEARVVQFEVTLPQKEVGGPVISPDGQHVAYSATATSSSQRMIFLRSLNSLDTHPLPGTEGVGDLSWSPDSSQITFGTTSALKKISITGGAPQIICNQAASDIAWNRDGVILFRGEPGQGLFGVAAGGGEPKPVTKLNPARQETAHFLPQFLPDGRHFIYLALSAKPENSGTYLGSLDSPEVKRIHDGDATAVYAQPGYLIFIRGTKWVSGALMAQRLDIRRAELSGDPVVVADSVETYAASAALYGFFSVSQNRVLTYRPGSGTTGTQLAWFDRSGKRLGTVGEPADYSNPAISPDQEMVAVGKQDPQTKSRDIWVIHLQRGTSSRLTFDPADDTNPTWSPDGASIAFSSNRKGHRDIYVKAASGVEEEQVLVESAEDKSIEDWSADGQYLGWGVDATGYEWLFSFRHHKILPFLQAKFLQTQCRFSPNHGGPPRWIAYTSDETGAGQVYVRSFAGVLSGSGGKWQISTDGGSEPMWRGDGKELFYLNGNKLMAVEVNGEGESFRPGIPKELFEARVRPEQLRNRYVVTSDGKRFLMNILVEQQEHATLRVVLNWPGLLKR